MVKGHLLVVVYMSTLKFPYFFGTNIYIYIYIYIYFFFVPLRFPPTLDALQHNEMAGCEHVCMHACMMYACACMCEHTRMKYLKEENSVNQLTTTSGYISKGRHDSHNFHKINHER